jgi:hypothetical protein
MLVPEVVAVAVPEVITLEFIELTTAPDIVGLVKVLLVSVSVVALPTKVSVVVGKVSVGVPATAGAVIVTAPEVSPDNTTALIQPP